MPDENRHNIFHFLHKALRFGHCRILAALGTHDFGDARASEELLGRLMQLMALSRSQLGLERSVLYPAMRARGHEPASGQEQGSHETALAELESLIRSIKVAIPARRKIAGHTLYRCYALFAAADMARMDAGETNLLSVLHASFTDEELLALEGRLFGALAREELGTCLQLMIPALSPPERNAFLVRLEGMFAPEAFSTLRREVIQPLLQTAEAA
jgi:hypothetical protein